MTVSGVLCSLSKQGGRLLDGWKNLVESGAVTEKCLPFVSHDGVGRSCPTTTRCAAGEVERFFADRGTLVRPVDLTSIQTLLSRDGPLSATISVYEDFLMCMLTLFAPFEDSRTRAHNPHTYMCV